VERVLSNPQTRTRDIGGSLATDAFAEAVKAALRDVTSSGADASGLISAA
jgi:isocitrate/isopropylmalate dehydrogenase